MQSSDGTQPWCPGQSMWCLIAEHITGSELPKIQAALGNTLVNQYRDIHAEVSHLSCLQKIVSLLWVPYTLWMKLVWCTLYLPLCHTVLLAQTPLVWGAIRILPIAKHSSSNYLWTVPMVVRLYLGYFGCSHSIVAIPSLHNKSGMWVKWCVLLRSKPARHQYLLKTGNSDGPQTSLIMK